MPRRRPPQHPSRHGWGSARLRSRTGPARSRTGAARSRTGAARSRTGGARRALAGGLLAAGLAVVAAGCAKFDAALGKREAVVQFKPGASTADRLKVRAACSHVSQVTAEPLPTSHVLSAQIYDVRYLVSNASDAELARFEECLQRFPWVAGIVFESPGGG